LRPREAWLHAAVVDPHWRNQGVYGQLLEFVIHELREAGVERIVLGVTFGNEPSRRAHARYGATKVTSILAIRSFGFNFCVRSGHVTRALTQLVTWHRPIRFAVEE